jgi:hypothetical protein
MERIMPMLEMPQSPEPYKNFIQKESRRFDRTLFMGWMA